MAKVNLQIRLPEEIDSQIAKLAPKSKSDFVRQAVQEKVQREMFKKLEEQWIEALKKDPEDSKEAEVWIKAEHWDVP